MPLISVWKCAVTEELFEDKGEYIDHLKILARQNLDERNRERLRDSCLPVINRMKETCENFQEIIDYLKANIDTFVKHYVYNDPFSAYHNLKYKKNAYPILDFKIGKRHPFQRHNAILSGCYVIVYKKTDALGGPMPTNIFDKCGIYFGSGSGILIDADNDIWRFSGEWHILPNTGWKLVEVAQVAAALMKE